MKKAFENGLTAMGIGTQVAGTAATALARALLILGLLTRFIGLLLAIDMFVGLCTLSRADSLVRANHPAAESAIAICEIFTHQAHRRMSRNVRALTHNEDEQVDKLAGKVLEVETYPFDVI